MSLHPSLTGLLLIVAGLGLGGCFATKPDAPPPIMAASLDPATGLVPATPQPGLDGYAIELQRVQFDVPRGTVIGEVRKPPMIYCHGGGWGTVTYGSSRFEVKPREWQDAFHRVMTGYGYRVAGAPDGLFEEREDNEAEYVFGANIVEMSVDGMVLCDFISAATTGMTGKSRIVVDWQLYDPMRRRVVYREKIEGNFTSDRVMPIDNVLMIKMAFADSVNKLAGKEAVRKVVATKPTRDALTPAGSSNTRMALARQSLSSQPIDTQIDRIRGATVMIEARGGHGSGFLVASNGLIVTNAHVVGGQKSVRVNLVSGRVVAGEVLRLDRERDVALVKIEGEGHPVLALRESPVRITEEVYAVGTPLLKQLGWTITRGVVSAMRPARPPRQPYDLIQADVTIHGGNSGGPLLDRQGNVVAISVIGWAMDEGKRNTGLNGFIPILDGLDKLGLELTGPAAPETGRRVSTTQ